MQDNKILLINISATIISLSIMQDQGYTNPLISPFYKSYARLLCICINTALSAFFVGYSLVYMGSLSLTDFKQAIIVNYGFLDLGWSTDESVYKSIIQGAVPVGAIIGALSASIVIAKFSRRQRIDYFRNGFLFVNIPAFVSIVLMVYIKNPYIFLIMRLIQGICTGIYSAIVPLYINQIVTPDCTNLGSLNQVFIAFAQFFCFCLAFILHNIFQTNTIDTSQTSWKVISQFPLIIIVIQTVIFLSIFPYQTPKYLFETGLIQEATDLIGIIYRQEHIDEAMTRYTGTPSVTEQQTSVAVKSSLIGVANRIQIKRNIKIAVFFAIHLALLQQMSGVNAIVIYGKNTFEQALKNDTAVGWATIGLTGAPFISAIITIKLMNIKGRKFLIQLGTLICSLCLAGVGVAFYFKKDLSYENSVVESIGIIIGMCIFMAVFGLTLGPIVWLYIPQIVQSNIIPYSTMVNLLGAACCAIGFPLISDPTKKYIPFVFFFMWCLVSLFVNQKIMVESKDRDRARVFEQFRAKRIC